MHLDLNGPWQCGLDRQYDRTATVPGLAGDPAVVTPGELWYRREVHLPEGEWTRATLRLNGARFAPRVYVDGEQVSASAGGMAPTLHRLEHPAVKPGATVTLEIALTNLDDLPADDASRIPAADRWRSNISSCIWDDVTLITHRDAWIRRIDANPDLVSRCVELTWDVETLEDGQPRVIEFRLQDADGVFVADSRFMLEGPCGSGVMELPEHVETWSPEHPTLYRLEAAVFDDDGVMHVCRRNLGLRTFEVDGKRFKLNGRDVTFRSGSVVWHRWVRDPESHDLAWDLEWFEQNVARRLLSHGANGLRFHLGSPPEAFLDLCDRLGLLVQAEWLFFHGMKASRESLIEQWAAWLDLCRRHPCVVIHHPWNETEGDELNTAFSAIEELSEQYPPLVISHRDVLHIHKYWWSMFENVGVYYDDAEQFSQPIVADEFGGNYLDGWCNPGFYPALRGSFLRFLGVKQTAADRLWLHTEANARIAEYWRRIGAAGFSPFCILGPPEDGNHHFLGPLAEGNPKPVWDALTAAYSPRSVSLEIWDRNYRPGELARATLHLLNECDQAHRLPIACRVVNQTTGEFTGEQTLELTLPPNCSAFEDIQLQLPAEPGQYRLQAELTDPPETVTHRVISHWDVQTFWPVVPDGVRSATVGLCGDENELRAFCESLGIVTAEATDPSVDVILTGQSCWNRIAAGGCNGAGLAAAIDRQAGVVMLDVGPRELGQGYLDGDDLGPLQGGMYIAHPDAEEYPVVKGVKLRFGELPEPESHIHPAPAGEPLWWNLPRRATWLWNGLRGGLIVPARDMEAQGLQAEALLATWTARGADAAAIRAGDYHAYELAGQYAFSVGESDEVPRELRRRVQFLVDDAPALAGAINPHAEILHHDLSAMLAAGDQGQARTLTPLVRAGKDLVRTPVIEIEFAPGQGRLICSQLLTAGRLAEGFGSEGPFGLRTDPGAQQLTLNLLARALQRS
ncbi:MAG: glycoside hydrolase [Phycisphaerae bacterium]